MLHAPLRRGLTWVLGATGVVMRVLVVGALAVLFAFPVAEAARPQSEAITLTDSDRGRDIMVQLYFPAPNHSCVKESSCPVAFLSPGYRIPHTNYSFLAEMLAARGYLSVAIQHDLPTDPPLTGEGDLVTIRTPAWQRGADNLRFVKAELSKTHPNHDWAALALVGHSNGGDLSAYLMGETPGFAKQLVTLDHRRVALPRDPSLQVLSIRGSDFEADPGVLPSEGEQASSGTCVIEIVGSRHNDMHDGGPSELKAQISLAVGRFLHRGGCGA